MREPDVDGLLRRLSWRQFSEWQAYLTLDPFGDDRADWRIAQLAALLANLQRNPKRRAKAYESRDFLLKFKIGGPAERRTTWQQQKQALLNVLDVHQAKLVAEARKRRKQRQP